MRQKTTNHFCAHRLKSMRVVLISCCQESARQKERRLQSDRSGLFFTALLPNIQIFGGEIVEN
jgi:hypothetical protein